MRLIRRAGGSRFGCLLLALAAGLLWQGAQSCYVSSRNGEPLHMTMQQYLQTKPNAEWLELRDAVVFLPGAMHIYNKLAGDSTAPASELYVPVYAAEPTSDDQPTNVVLKTSDPELVRIYNAAGAAGNDTARIARLFEENRKRLVETRTVSGVVQFGIDLDDKDKELVRDHVAHTGDFVILADGTRPTGRGGSGLMILAGLAVLVLSGWQLSKD
jgi:hypothetical protein